MLEKELNSFQDYQELPGTIHLYNFTKFHMPFLSSCGMPRTLKFTITRINPTYFWLNVPCFSCYHPCGIIPHIPEFSFQRGFAGCFCSRPEHSQFFCSTSFSLVLNWQSHIYLHVYYFACGIKSVSMCARLASHSFTHSSPLWRA